MSPSRREAMALFAASMVAACGRPPPTDALPYVNHPPGLVPGQARGYATAFVEHGFAEGLVVTSHEGRPTKVEGNPQHPASLGATRARAQASVLGLYDPDRSRMLRRGGNPEAPRVLTELLAAPHPNLHVLLEPSTSPTVARLLDALRARRPDVHIHCWEPGSAHAALAGARIAYGAPVHSRPDLAAARVIVSIGADLLDDAAWSVRNARDWAGRRVPPHMSRMYVAEAAPTLTGLAADVRVGLPPGQVPAFAAALADAVFGAGPWSAWTLPENARAAAVAAAADLQASAGECVVAAGWDQPAWVHALVAALNAALAAASSLAASPWITPEPDLSALRNALVAGNVGTLVVLGGNPLFNEPTLSFAQAGLVVRVGMYDDETSVGATWQVPELHALESWGDARAFDGTVTFVQPLIRPMVEGWTLPEVLARLAEVPGDTRTLLRNTWTHRFPDASTWEAALRYGSIPDSAAPPLVLHVDLDAVRRAVPPPPPDDAPIVLAVRTCPRIGDGRHANNPWLQELPDPISQVAWANPAWLGPATASALGLASPSGLIDVDGVRLPAIAVPGHPEGTVTLTRGYGRRIGAVGGGVGVDVEALAARAGQAVAVRVLAGGVSLPVAQLEWTRDRRAVGRVRLRARPRTTSRRSARWTSRRGVGCIGCGSTGTWRKAATRSSRWRANTAKRRRVNTCARPTRPSTARTASTSRSTPAVSAPGSAPTTARGRSGGSTGSTTTAGAMRSWRGGLVGRGEPRGARGHVARTVRHRRVVAHTWAAAVGLGDLHAHLGRRWLVCRHLVPAQLLVLSRGPLPADRPDRGGQGAGEDGGRP